MKADANELLVGSLIARRIADVVHRSICKPPTRKVRCRSQHQWEQTIYWLERGQTLYAQRCRRGLDPFCASSDFTSEFYAQLVEALLYVRRLRNESRRLRIAAYAMAKSPVDLITAPLMVDHAECLATAQKALDDIGIDALVVA